MSESTRRPYRRHSRERPHARRPPPEEYRDSRPRREKLPHRDDVPRRGNVEGPIDITGAPVLPTYAILRGYKVSQAMERGRVPQELNCLITLAATDAFTQARADKILRAYAAHLAEDCHTLLGTALQFMEPSERPKSLFTEIPRLFGLPSERAWRLWAFKNSRERPREVTNNREILAAIEDCQRSAVERRDPENQWVMYLVVEVQREWPKLFAVKYEDDVEDVEKKQADSNTDRASRHSKASKGKGPDIPPTDHRSDGNSSSNRTGKTSTTPHNGTLLRDLAADNDDSTHSHGNNLEDVLPIADSPSDREWTDCCRLLLLNPDEHKNPQVRSIEIPGTRLTVTPRQYWTAFQMLTWRATHDMAGGLLADVPGSGKTHTVLAFCLLRALIFHNYTEVQGSSLAKARKHLPLTTSAKTAENLRCTCGNSHGIECYATPGSITRRIIAAGMARGPSLIQVAPHVLEDWKTALCAAKPSSTFYHAVLFQQAAAGQVTPHALQKPADLKAQLKCTAKVDASALSASVSAAGGDSSSRKPELKVQDCTFAYSPDGMPEGKAPERFIFLTTHEAAALKAEFQIQAAVGSKRASAAKQATVYGCPVGVHIVDEFHRTRDVRTSAVQLALAHKHIRHSAGGPDGPDGKNFEFWAVSGTPLPTGRFADLTSLRMLLEQPSWATAAGGEEDKTTKEVPVFRKADGLAVLDRFRERAQASTAVASDRATFATLATAATRDFVIRHTLASRFFGAPTITGVADVVPERISFATPRAFRLTVQWIADGARARFARIHPDPNEAAATLEGYRVLSLLQLLSSFPAAARLLAEGTAVSANLLGLFTDPSEAMALLGTAEARDDVGAVPLFGTHWRAITDRSPKLDFVLRLLDDMEEDRQERSEGPPTGDESQQQQPGWADTGTDGRAMNKKKLVIITLSLVEAVFYYLALRHARPELQPVLFHHKLPAAAKAQMLAGWAGTRRTAPASRVFVAPFDLAGTGLNLQRANYQVLTGPLRTAAYETQCFRRTNREGQALPLHHYVLLGEDNPCDRLLAARQAGRRIVSCPFALEEPLRVERRRAAGPQAE